jgi:hypothetical protein
MTWVTSISRAVAIKCPAWTHNSSGYGISNGVGKPIREVRGYCGHGIFLLTFQQDNPPNQVTHLKRFPSHPSVGNTHFLFIARGSLLRLTSLQLALAMIGSVTAVFIVAPQHQGLADY